MGGGKIAATLSALALTGCATQASDISAAYVSPAQYPSFTCQQLQEEAARVSSNTAIASGPQDQKVNNDAVATGASVLNPKFA
jgi:hypothetical protein